MAVGFSPTVKRHLLLSPNRHNALLTADAPMSTPPNRPRSPRDYRWLLDHGCKHTRLGGVRVWLRVKHVSQLLVISFGFWGGVTGELNPTLAFMGILAAYIGVEQLESLLVSIGENAAGVQIEREDEEEPPKTDGGRIEQLIRGRDR